ncbi:FAD/NAD(P)-binding domain containing protein [Hyaloscypha variabilis]
MHPIIKTQAPLGMFEFPCYPMEKLPKDKTFHNYFPGSHVTAYLEDFATHKAFSRKTLKDRIVFNSHVKHIIKTDKLWAISINLDTSFNCEKLIIATGLTSTPNLPSFPKDDFSPPVIHTRSLAANIPLLNSPSINDVVVIGGSKSAFDAVQILHSLNKTVKWIIRTSGQGPAFLAAPNAPWPLHSSHDIISMRLVAKMSPCIYEPVDNWSRICHGNKVGIRIVDAIWWFVDWTWRRVANFDRDENMKGLKPGRPLCLSADGLAVSNSEGLWDNVANATVLRDEVESAEGKDLILKSGKRVTCDAVIAATGWSNTYPMFDNALATELGLPLPFQTPQEDGKAVAEWETLLAEADKKVVETFPRLANLPTYPHPEPKSTPNKLFRSIIPISGDIDHSIAFVGAIGSAQSLNVAEIQALWAAAYLSKKLTLPTVEKMKQEVALATAWRKRRYLEDGYNVIFEHVQYMSLLLRDLGLNDQRKGGGWRELLEPYVSADFKGILDEWRRLHDLL